MLSRHSRGFTLVELVVTIALLAVLMGLAVPSFSTWTRNAQVRTVSDALQNGVRLAQTDAMRRSRQVVFYLTNTSTCTTSTSPAANGSFWAIKTVPLTSGDDSQMVQCGNLSDRAGNVDISGPIAICFNSLGRQVANASPGIGTTVCSLASSGLSTYNISGANADRALRVLVTLGGQVRQCDPARSLSSTDPDGCP